MKVIYKWKSSNYCCVYKGVIILH